jgi:hypothetical protein
LSPDLDTGWTWSADQDIGWGAFKPSSIHCPHSQHVSMWRMRLRFFK